MIQLEMFQILRQLNLVTMLILVVCKRHVIHEHCYGQIQHRVLSNPVSEHRRVDSKDLWVDSFWGSTYFLFSYALCEKKKNGIFQCFESNIGFLFPPFAYNFRHQLR